MADDGTTPPSHRAPAWSWLRTRRAAVIAAFTAAAACVTAAVALTLPSHHAPTAATAEASTAASPTPSHDPLTGSVLHGAPDHTGAAHQDAEHALKTWNASSIGTSPGRAGTIRAVLRIPALGSSWSEPIYNGVGDQQLAAGIGHFPGTEEAGQVGNYALAGHRSGVAAPPLRNITAIKPGSTIRVTTATRITYTYTVAKVHTVAPTDVDVIAEVPGQPKATPAQATLTLITCWPANGHAKRVVVEAHLTKSQGGTS